MGKRNRGGGQDPGRKARRDVFVEDVALAEAARTRYLNYALSVITSRALPDIRDGLKPVQRRILYAMFADLHVTAESRYIKCAAVVGEVMKTYHPHGDQSIYDALVRMAQPFSVRHTLVDGYGNFGSIDGDPPAAFRYTECRLTPIAMSLLTELREQTVDFRPNYSATEEEPEVLPAQFPNLLVNGASGIAVGMATNIPPHNLKEVCNALVALLDNRELPAEKLSRYVLGPDFPTGGTILNGPDDIRQIYATGQGSIKLRGTYEKHPDRPNTVIITAIPYGIEKDALVERIGDLIGKGQVPQLVNVKDLSTDDIQIVLELRPGASPDAALAYLYKNTPLQVNYNVNLTCLLPAAGAEVAVPARLDLKTILQHFLDFRMEVVTRRLQFELKNLLDRIHILEGFAIVFNNLDEAIAIIRASDGKADAAPKLIARFGLTEIQADAVLETKLYRLGKLEIKDILQELREKKKRAAELKKLLQDEPARWAIIRDELKQVAKTYGDARRTRIEAQSAPIEFREEDYIVDEDSWVIVTREGWTKRQRSFADVASIRVRDDDSVGWVYRARARQTITFFTDRGIAYTLRVNDIPLTTGHGEPIQKQFAFEDQEHIVGVICHDPRCLPDPSKHPQTAPRMVQRLFGDGEGEGDGGEARKEPSANGAAGANGHANGDGHGPGTPALPPPPYAIALTAGGKVLRFSLAPLAAVSTRKGRVAAKLDPSFRGDRVVGVEATDGSENVCLATRMARVLIFPVVEANIVAGAARGVAAIKLHPKDQVVGFVLANKKREGLTVRTNRGSTQIVRATKYPVTGRGGHGYAILQRGSIDAVLPADVEPVPPADQVDTSADGKGQEE
ncbi:DNA gyrase subunit A [Aquisphaera giovannonii]|uniref:DNA topoisomerase (ATP-hydrolyzing) n=1 Tax=Aquisphaera giovannonii TaxID=406548 RepID=A0A5B9WCG5_9BACT|nr:DNA topoisomerase (ATP-hydrolyzing) [Aquisphaera giovannonii]QEH38272.1 DNA gyrase subunit A [Aquisphaera giovannonii]